MKAKRRDILKAFVAGATGIATMGFVNKASAKAVHSMAKKAKKSKLDEPTKFVKFGKLVYVSGMAWNPGELAEGMKPDQMDTIENHTAVAMKKVKDALIEAGSGMDKALKAVVYIDDIAYYTPMGRAYGAAWTAAGGRAPNRSCIAVPKGGIPGGSKLKVEVIAHT